uniref:NAD(+) ADP-ribosyltransferase n=1 Tax=Plectus sambesii TaxID=2011161 RepID=A0A914W6K6_9BILA
MARSVRFSDALSIMAISNAQPSVGRRTSLCDSVSQSNPFSYESSPFNPLDLRTAASVGDLESVKNMIQRCDVNEPNEGGWTALMYAAYLGHDAVCSYLLDSGAKVDQRNHRLQTPLMLAATCGNHTTIRLLLKYHADLHATDVNGWTALFYGASSSQVYVVETLLEAGASPNQPDFQGCTAFLLACSEGHELIVTSCMQYGADLTWRTTNGETARALAAINGHTKVVAMLDDPIKTTATPPPIIHTRESSTSSDEYKKRNEHLPQGILHKPLAAVTPMHDQQVSFVVKPPSPVPNRPTTLAEFLGALKLEKYLHTFEEQKVDLQLFLQLSDADLSELGIKLFGPRKKISNAIARYHSQGPISGDYESQLAYANYQRQRSEEHKYTAEKLAKELMHVQEEMQRVEEDLRLARRQVNEQQKALHVCSAATKESRLATHKALSLLRKTVDPPPADLRQQVEACLAKIAANCDRQSLKLVEIGVS